MITTPEARKLTGLSKPYLASLAKSGKIEAKQYGRDWLIYKDSLLRYMAQERKPGPKGPTGPKKKRQQGKKISKAELGRIWKEANGQEGSAGA